MNLTADIELFGQRLDRFAPSESAVPRLLALFSAAVAIADDAVLRRCLRLAREYGIGRDDIYEVVLQSYLFLGFPRMLGAAERLHEEYKNGERSSRLAAVSAGESEQWFDRGVALCRRVYDGNYDLLKDRVEAMAPEVFRWMVFEGYGKVLARPQLPIQTRELAIVACLMFENRPKQLHSHMKGALNVEVPPALLRQVIEDIGESAGDGYDSARAILGKLGIE